MLQESGRVTIAGSRLGVQMGMLWHHLERNVTSEGGRQASGAEQCQTDPPPCREALDRGHPCSSR